MPKGPNGEKRPADVIGGAVMVAKIATGELEESGYAAPGRRKSGLSGAEARSKKLSAGERSTIAKTAAETRWKRSDTMTESGVDKLHTLLFKEGRELVNIKFFPGTNRGLTADRLCSAAAAALKAAFGGEMKNAPPVSGRKKASLKDAF